MKKAKLIKINGLDRLYAGELSLLENVGPNANGLYTYNGKNGSEVRNCGVTFTRKGILVDVYLPGLGGTELFVSNKRIEIVEP